MDFLATRTSELRRCSLAPSIFGQNADNRCVSGLSSIDPSFWVRSRTLDALAFSRSVHKSIHTGSTKCIHRGGVEESGLVDERAAWQDKAGGNIWVATFGGHVGDRCCEKNGQHSVPPIPFLASSREAMALDHLNPKRRVPPPLAGPPGCDPAAQRAHWGRRQRRGTTATTLYGDDASHGASVYSWRRHAWKQTLNL